jgi:hypothetical protein
MSSFFCAFTWERTYSGDISQTLLSSCDENLSKMGSAATRVHGYGTGWRLADKIDKRLPPHRSEYNPAPLSSIPTTLQPFFPVPKPNIEIVMDRLLPLQRRENLLDVPERRPSHNQQTLP